LLTSTAHVVVAQEPTFMDAATHPGRGQFYSRLLVSHSECEDAGTEAHLSTAVLKLSYGVRSTLALVLDTELAALAAAGDDETGISQATCQLKYQLLRRDLGPLNTWRTSIFGGFTVPGNVEAYKPEHTYPRCSLASTAILDRHGLNAEVEWQEYGDEPDRFAVNASHLYRVLPSEYTVATRGAWYTMFESLNEFTEDGQSRSDLALGVLYEARRWAWEVSVRFPLAQDWPRESEYTVTMGFRLLP
jgi:hypothetical protein